MSAEISISESIRVTGVTFARALKLALGALIFVAGNASAAYVFTYNPVTHIATATGDAATDALTLTAVGGVIEHSVNGSPADSNWTGSTVPAAVTETVNIRISTGDGSSLQLGDAVSPASNLIAYIAVVAPPNTTDQVIIDDSANSTPAMTYTVHTDPGFITAPGIIFDESGSRAFQGGIRLRGGSGGNTVTILSVCCAVTNSEPFTLNSGIGGDHVNLRANRSHVTLIGQGFDTVVIGSLAPATSGGTLAGIAGTVNVDNSLGLTDLTLDDSGGVTGRTATVTSAQIAGLAAGTIAYNGTSEISALTINAGLGSDSFTVTPWSQISVSPFPVTLVGGDPTPPTSPGDALSIDLSGGATGTALSANFIPGSGYSGSYSFANRNSVIYFSEFETLAPDQTIDFTSAAPVAAVVGGPTYTVSAVATSGLTVALTIDATATSVCSIAGTTVSFIGVGTCVIDANQTGNGTYLPAPQVQQSFAVGQGSQLITFTSTAPTAAAVGGATYTVAATTTSGLTVALTIDATATSVCSIAGTTVSFIGVGTCVIDANQIGNANYLAALQVQQSFDVKNPQTIAFTSAAPMNASVGGPTYAVTATATSGLTVAFTIDATAATVCSISGATVSFIGGGTCVINADQAGTGTYLPAPQVSQRFNVYIPATSVPTLNEWGMIVLSGLTGVFGLVYMRRRRVGMRRGQ